MLCQILLFTREYKAIWENLAVYQKSLRAFFQAALQFISTIPTPLIFKLILPSLGAKNVFKPPVFPNMFPWEANDMCLRLQGNTCYKTFKTFYQWHIMKGLQPNTCMYSSVLQYTPLSVDLLLFLVIMECRYIWLQACDCSRHHHLDFED